MRLVVLLAALAFTTPIHAQSEVATGAFTGITSFNPLDIERFETSLTFALDEAFTERTGKPVLAPAAMLIPTHPDLHMDTLPINDGEEFLEVGFYQPANDPRDRVFLESFRIFTATIPLHEDLESSDQARQQTAAITLERDILPFYQEEFPGLEVLGIGSFPMPGAPNAVQMILQFDDPVVNTTILSRSVIVTNPFGADSYLAIMDINLDEIAVVDANTLSGTITARILSTWRYQ